MKSLHADNCNYKELLHIYKNVICNLMIINEKQTF